MSGVGLILNVVTGLLERNELKVAKDYADALAAAVGNAVIFKGDWDASTGAFPAATGIKAGWTYIVSVAGTVDSVVFAKDDLLMAVKDNPSSSIYLTNWYLNTSPSLAGLEVLANKSTSVGTDKASNAKYPSVKSVYDWATTVFTTIANSWTGTQTFKGLKETCYTITDGEAFEIDPANGTMQIVTLGAGRTPLAISFVAGQSVTLEIIAGANLITWTGILADNLWIDGIKPTLSTTGKTTVILWRNTNGFRGLYVGDVA